MSVSRTSGTTKIISALQAGDQDGSLTSTATAMLETVVLAPASHSPVHSTKLGTTIPVQSLCPLETSARSRWMLLNSLLEFFFSQWPNTLIKRLVSFGKVATRSEQIFTLWRREKPKTLSFSTVRRAAVPGSKSLSLEHNSSWPALHSWHLSLT